jgi:hypothetical protein
MERGKKDHRLTGKTRTTNSDGSGDVLGHAGSADRGKHRRLAE